MENFTLNRYTCTFCGKSQPVEDSASGIFICPDCHRILYKKEIPTVGRKNLSNPVPEDLTPLCIGSKGIFQEKKFKIVGRVRYHSMDGYRNQWSVLFDGGKNTWLFEGYGAYALCNLSDKSFNPTGNSPIKPYKTVKIFDISYTLDSITKLTEWEAEGEFPDNENFGGGFICMALSNNQGDAAFLDTYTKEKINIYTGKSLDYADFNFTNTRALNEWS